jgi:hypothetical protein
MIRLGDIFPTPVEGLLSGQDVRFSNLGERTAFQPFLFCTGVSVPRSSSTQPGSSCATVLFSTTGSGGEMRQLLGLRFCRGRRKGSALKNLGGALHTDGVECRLSVGREIKLEIPVNGTNARFRT